MSSDIWIIIFLYACFLFFDVVPLFKTRAKKILLVYLPVFFITFILIIIQSMGTNLPSLEAGIKNAVVYILRLKV